MVRYVVIYLKVEEKLGMGMVGFRWRVLKNIIIYMGY